MAAPRPPAPNGQQQVIRPPPPQLRRTDSRSVLPTPAQILQQQQQQQQQQPQQRPIGPPPAQQQPPQFAAPNQGQRPPGPPGQQFQPPRPLNPSPLVRGPTPGAVPPPQQPLQQPPRPQFPQQQQQPPRPPFIRPQGGAPLLQSPVNPQGGPPFRPPIPGQQRPVGQPIRQPSSEQILRSQNSFERAQDPRIMNTPDPSKGSRPNSVLSNDDDDDVVMGRAATPGQIKRTPSDLQNPSKAYGQINPQLQRSDSKLSIPSRPPSATDQHSKSPSPDSINKPAAVAAPQYSSEYRAPENNLPKIPENSSKYDGKEMSRPPSVTFRDDIPDRNKTSPEPILYPKYGQSGGATSGTSKSPVSLNSIISDESSRIPPERISTPTSEKFRTSPMHNPQQVLATHERPNSLINGGRSGDELRLKSSLKFSKLIKY